METIKNFEEVLNYLRKGAILSRERNDLFLLRENKIYEYQNGNRFRFSLKQFKDLFSQENFSLAKEKSYEIDLTKDDDYYRYYHK